MGKLTARQIQGLAYTGKRTRHADGDGLYLEMRARGASWLFRCMVHGKPRFHTLGELSSMTLAQARAQRDEVRLALQAGKTVETQPQKIERQRAEAQARAEVPTAGELLHAFVEQKKSEISTWERTDNNIAQLSDEFMNLPVDTIQPITVIEELLRIAHSKSADMAHRIHGYIRTAFDTVLEDGTGTGAIQTNPARHPAVLNRLPPKERTVPMAHIDELSQLKAVISLIERLYHSDSGQAQTRALAYLQPRVFTRPTELRTLQWSALNWAEERFELVAGSTKKRRAHLVPLSSQCMRVLTRLYEQSSSQFIFPGAFDERKPLSDSALRSRLRSAGIGSNTVTPHGFRHTASTFLNEYRYEVVDPDTGQKKKLRFSSDAIEVQLAHLVEGSSTRVIYNRARYLDERIMMMQAWSDFLDTLIDPSINAMPPGPTDPAVEPGQPAQQLLAVG